MNEEEKYNIPGREQKSPKVELTNESAGKCLCPGCPTYNSSECTEQKEERIYCSIGKTECGVEQRGCLCGNCPVFTEHDLKIGYFCTKGEADDSGSPAMTGEEESI